MQKKEISIVTQKKLQKLLSYTGKKEQQLEFLRQNLCKLEAFEPYASFQRLDRTCKGYIVPRDFLTFLSDNAIDSFDEVDAKLLIHFFDSTFENKLQYKDYLQMLLPCDQPFLRATATQRTTYPITQKDFLPFQVERVLSKLIQRELKLAKNQESIKQELQARYDFDATKLFKEIDDWNYKFIDLKNLKRFLIKMGVAPTETHLIAIIRRFDLDSDAKLSLGEFKEGIQAQLDFSKRTIKERTCKPSVNNRELALSPGRVPETQAINKEDTINVHHSPLRQKRHLSARRVTVPAVVLKDVKDKVQRMKTCRNKKSRQIRSKPFSTGVEKRVITSDTLQKEFSSFKRAMDKSRTREEENKDEVLYCVSGNKFESIITSPNKTTTTIRDQTPIRASRTHVTPSKNTSYVSQKKTNKSWLSPKSPLTRKSLKIDTSPIQCQDLSYIRAMRSPYASQIAKAEEGDASLIYLVRDAFKEILAIEGGLEQSKKELAHRSDFTLAGAFMIFSDNTHGRINETELLYGLEKLGISSDIGDSRLVIDRYDSDRDGRLGFWEFSNALLPIQAQLRDEIERRRAIWDISKDTTELIQKTFRQIVDAEVMIESIRQSVQRDGCVKLRQAFDSLDWLGRGFLTNNEFKRSFEKISERLGSPQARHSVVVRVEDSIEMEAMIRRFNKDKLNGRISVQEFLDELTPKCPERPY